MNLVILIFSPLIFSIILLLPIFSGRYLLIRRSAKIFAAAHFIYTLLFWVFFNTDLPSNFDTQITFGGLNWLGSLGISLNLGIDGIALLFVILTSLLVLLACIASKGLIKSKHSLYYALIFMVEVAVLGVFCSKDMFEFFLFWELELIPMYFLISLWGHGNAKKSAMKFLLYTFIGSMFMLCGFLLLYNFNYISTSELTANIDNLNFDYDSVPIYLQVLVSILIFLGFAVKLPIIPLHNWLPDAHVDAPTPVSMLLAGILLKMGGYGIIRFNIQILPDAFLLIIPYIAILAFINIVFAAFVAYYQTDIKKIVAYSSISSMGIVLLGLCAINDISITGAIYLMFAHGIISAGLFYVVGVIYRRTSTRDINELGGLASVMPRFSSLSTILALSSIGLPLFVAFPAEFLVFFGSFISSALNNYLIQVIALSSIVILILSACYMLKFIHNIFQGEINERWCKIRDLAVHEFIVLFVLSAISVIFGVIPMIIINLVLPNVRNIIAAFGG